MKKSALQCILFLALACMALVSCQSEENEASQPNPENLTKASALTGLLQRMITTDSVSDNIVDSTACFRIKRPYKVYVHDSNPGQIALAYTAEVTDNISQQQLNATMAGMTDDGDQVTFYFPITVVYADGSETVVHNYQELNIARMQCDPAGTSTDPITCANINYPITIFSYNVNFQVAETYTIDNDAELAAMIAGVTPGQFFAIDFPVSLTLSDGSILTATSNEQLAGIIQQAITLCNTPVINPCNNTNVLTNGLILYMPIAGEAIDLISEQPAIHTPNYPPAFVTDRAGNAEGAVSFSGNNLDFLKIMATDAYNINDDTMSISLWYKSQDTDMGNFEHLFEKSDGTNVGFGLALYDLNRPLIYSNQNFNLWDPATTANSSWHHLVMIVEETATIDQVTMYKDGQMVATVSTMTSFSLNTQSFNYIFGRGFKGVLDDVRVYNKALSANEVHTLYSLPADVFHCVN